MRLVDLSIERPAGVSDEDVRRMTARIRQLCDAPLMFPMTRAAIMHRRGGAAESFGQAVAHLVAPLDLEPHERMLALFAATIVLDEIVREDHGEAAA